MSSLADRMDQLLFDVGGTANSKVDFDGIKARILQAQARRRRARLIRTWSAAAACLVVGVCSVLFFGREYGVGQDSAAADSAPEPMCITADAAAAESSELDEMDAGMAADGFEDQATAQADRMTDAAAADAGVAVTDAPKTEPVENGIDVSALTAALPEEYYDMGQPQLTQAELQERVEKLEQKPDITFLTDAPMPLTPGQACAYEDGAVYYRSADGVMRIVAEDAAIGVEFLRELLQ